MSIVWKDILKFGNEGFVTIDEDPIKEFRWIGEVKKRKIGIAVLKKKKKILCYVSKDGTDGKRKGAFYRIRNLTVNHPNVGESETGRPNVWFAKYREDFNTPEMAKLDKLYAEGKLPKYVREFLSYSAVNSIARFEGVELGHPDYPQYYDRRRDG